MDVNYLNFRKFHYDVGYRLVVFKSDLKDKHVGELVFTRFLCVRAQTNCGKKREKQRVQPPRRLAAAVVFSKDSTCTNDYGGRKYYTKHTNGHMLLFFLTHTHTRTYTVTHIHFSCFGLFFLSISHSL